MCKNRGLGEGSSFDLLSNQTEPEKIETTEAEPHPEL